ncbi:MAG TPA: ribonuclease Y [Waddliaceae bacterium]
MTDTWIISALICAGIGAKLSLFAAWLVHKSKVGSYRRLSEDLVSRGQLEADEIRKTAEIEAKRLKLDQQREFEIAWQKERFKLQQEENRLKQREDKIEIRMQALEKKIGQIEKKEAELTEKRVQNEEEQQKYIKMQKLYLQELEKVSGMTVAKAREVLFEKISQEIQAEAALMIRRAKKEAEEEAEKEASRIIITAIHRLAVPCVSEVTVNTIPLPNEEMKGRIIGREGRNIRTLERLTGVNFVIDDTPGAVVLSGFDPIRLHVAKTALTELMVDGRIHPTRIEETVEKAQQAVVKKIKEYGEDAALRSGQINLHPEIMRLLGKLKFRYSYGQNVLDHSLEVSALMGMMAAELHIDPQLAKRIGLLHDIGKAVSHEIEGTHAIIGQNLALKYGESEEVANGIGCHHYEIEPLTTEGSLCSAADAISASRPGARIEEIEKYIKRLKNLEELAYSFPGIEKAYAMQAGREICIIVMPDMIDDTGTGNLARDLSKKIEQELNFPGKIKVTVIRERRVVEYAG